MSSPRDTTGEDGNVVEAAREVAVTIDRRKVARVLYAVPALFMAVSLPLEYLWTQRGWSSVLTNRFRVSGEGTLPTWWSSFLLLACALALFVIARGDAGRLRRRDWTLLAVIFVYMSIDELVQIHELLNGTQYLSGAIYFAWVIPAAAFVILAGVRFLPFVLSLPPRRRRQFIVAGVVYVGAALGMEVPLGYVAQSYGGHSLAYRVVDSFEETFEIVGLSLFLIALLEALPPLRVFTSCSATEVGATRADARTHSAADR